MSETPQVGQNGGPEQERPDLLHRVCVLSKGVIVETCADHALVEFADEHGETLALLEVPYSVIAVFPEDSPDARLPERPR